MWYVLLPFFGILVLTVITCAVEASTRRCRPRSRRHQGVQTDVPVYHVVVIHPGERDVPSLAEATECGVLT